MADYRTFLVSLEGIPQAIAAAKELERRIKRGGMRTALTKASSIMLAKAKALCPVGPTGLLKRSLKKKTTTNTRTDAVTVRIGADKKVQKKVGDEVVRPARYLHLVELGHGGPHPAPPHPFLRPAYETTIKEVTAQYTNDLRAAIEKTTARLVKTGGSR